MSATGRSYTQNFFKVQYLIIQAILSRIAVTDEKIFYVYQAFYHKNNSHADMRTSHAQLLGKGSEHGEEDSKNKILS